MQFKIKPDASFCTFARTSTTKVQGGVKGMLSNIFDAGVERVDNITIKAPIGELQISEVDVSALVAAVHSR